MSIHLNNGTIDILITGIDTSSDFVTVHTDTPSSGLDGERTAATPTGSAVANDERTNIAHPVDLEQYDEYQIDFELLDQL